MDNLLLGILALLVVVAVLLVALLLRKPEEHTEERLRLLREELQENQLQFKKDVLNMLQTMGESNLKTVDSMGAKLENTLNTRLEHSYRLVNEQLEKVTRGIGEMHSLASEVGDLKKVLGNVKLRGNLGEIQLEGIIREILTREQYETNCVTVPGSNARVEFAVRLPGNDGESVFLPIDSKFPGDTYSRLQDALEEGDKEEIKNVRKSLRERILSEARDIREKYIQVPYTTDFGILFLPFEGLYSEVLNLDVFDELQTKYHIMLAGPNTMAALLSSLRMGFRTLAVEKRTDEVREALEAVKAEFGRFDEALGTMKSHLDQTGKDLDKLIGTRSNAIKRKLKSFDNIEVAEAEERLQINSECGNRNAE